MSKNAPIEIAYEVEVRDKKGKLLSKQERLCKSFVANFGKWLRSKFTRDGEESYAAPWTATDTSNIGRNFPETGSSSGMFFGTMWADAAEETHGIRIGTSETVVDKDDYELIARIAHGTGSGQMLYGTTTTEAMAYEDETSRFRTTRGFTNNSGVSISVKEIGCALLLADNASADRFLLILRDVLVSPSSVPDGATLTVRYRVSVTA